MSSTALLLVILVVSTPLDVGGYLERSAEAEFTGEQLVACDTPDGDRSSVFNLAQQDGAVIAWNRGEEAPIVRVAPGSSVTSTGEAVEATVVEGTARQVSPDHYTARELGRVTYLGRPGVEVALVRDGDERVRMTIDDATGAVVRSVTYDGAGSQYCDRRLLSFEEDVSGVPEVAVEAEAEPLAPIEEAPGELDATIAGFELVDTYSLDDGTLSYYSDGFFSVGVALTSRPISFAESDEVVEVEKEAGTYRRAYQAGSVTITWEADAGNFVVIGDLPPDLLEAFIEEMPAPRQGGFLDRIWSRLFG